MRDEYQEKLDRSDMTASFPVNRRDFIKYSGSGIFLLFSINHPSLLAQRRDLGYPDDFNAYLRIGDDGRVTCFTGKIEMGQGVITSLAQELAEELAVALESVDMVMGDTDLCPYDRGTWGSMTTRFFGPALRAAGAEARAVLLELASEYLAAAPEQLRVENGIIHNTDKTKKITYAQLARGTRIEKHLQIKPQLKKAADFKVMGVPVKHRDSQEKVTGKAEYTGDVRIPGMLYARILRPPAHGAELISVDTSAAEQIEGVQVVRDGEMIAVLHQLPDVADTALSRIKTSYSQPEAKVNDQNIFDHLVDVASEGDVVAEEGDVKKGQALTAITLEQTYLDGYVAHAPIETHTALAKFEGSKISVWASTQTPFGVRDQVAEAFGLPKTQVRVITPFVGGGFGGKSPSRQALEAARLAKLTGKPVQVAWSRAEEFFYDTYRPAAVVKIKSGLTGSGRISYWDYGVYFAGSRGSDHFYDIPHHRTVSYDSVKPGSENAHPFATGAWRAPANNTNTFARESQIHMMAAKAGIDPLEFWLANLKEEKMKRALRTAADRFGWTAAKSPSGRGFGIACGTDVGTFVAAIAQIQVDKKTGQVRVNRVVCAQDMGLVVNPQGATLQMESCINMGIGYALTEDIHFQGGKILDTNFDTYEIPRFSSLPQIDTILVDSKDPAPQGGGEPAIIVMGGVIANAIYDAIGVRMRQLPMTPDRIKEAVARG